MKRSTFLIFLIAIFFISNGHATEWTWSKDVQFNTDDNYETVEGTGKTTAIAILNEDGSIAVEGKFVKYSGKLSSFVNVADVIATDGLYTPLQRRSMSAGGFSIYQTSSDTWEFKGRVYNAILPKNNGHFEVALFSNYNNKPYYFFVNTESPIDEHYLPSLDYREITTTTISTSTTLPMTTTTICGPDYGSNPCTTKEGFDGLCRWGRCWPIVACCKVDNSCEEINEYDCIISGPSKSQGAGSKCHPNPCVKEISTTTTTSTTLTTTTSTTTTIETTTTIPTEEKGIPWSALIIAVIILGAVVFLVMYYKARR